MNVTDLLLKCFPNPPLRENAPLNEVLMRQLLAGHPKRIDHSEGTWQLARQISTELGLSSLESENVLLATLFHDIGRAPALQVTGFHPLDGAIFLAHHAAPEVVVQAVLFHRLAKAHSGGIPAAASFYASLPEPDRCLATEVVDFCDLRISREGHLVSMPERIQSILARRGADPLRRHQIIAEIPACRQQQSRILSQIARKAPHPLPWVFLDVDHTLMEPGETLSSFSLKTIEEYRQAGGRISLATGKHPLAIQGITSRLHLAGPHVAGNGCLIFQNSTFTQLASLGPMAGEIVERLTRLEIPYIIYCLEGLFGHPDFIQEQHFQAFRELQEPRPALREPRQWEPVFKVLTFLNDTEIETEAHLRKAARRWKVETVRTSSRFLEFVPAGSGKGAAVREVLAQAGWPQFHSLAIGDSENDLSMFRITGRCAAVGNASEEVRQKADILTADCREDGVARILEMILTTRGSTEELA